MSVLISLISCVRWRTPWWFDPRADFDHGGSTPGSAFVGSMPEEKKRCFDFSIIFVSEISATIMMFLARVMQSIARHQVPIEITIFNLQNIHLNFDRLVSGLSEVLQTCSTGVCE